MTHYSRLARLLVDVPADAHDAEVAFLQEALGVTLTRSRRFPNYHWANPGPAGLELMTQKLGEGPARVHLDIDASDRAAEVARLVGLGATVVDNIEHWTVMRDPAGLLFCVVADAKLDMSIAHTWSD